MATASDNFCNDKKVMNLNHHWSMEVFPSYMSTLTLGAEKVSACVEASAFLVVLVCRRFNWCRKLLYILLFFNLLQLSLEPGFSALLLLILLCSRICVVFSFSCYWCLNSDSWGLSSSSLFPSAGVFYKSFSSYNIANTSFRLP